MPHNITIRKLFRRMKYELDLNLMTGEGGLDKKLDIAEVNRPGLALCGHYDHFAHDRIQVLGNGEIAYLKKIDEAESAQAIKKLLSYPIPCVVVTRGLEMPKTLIEEGNAQEIPVFFTKLSTPVFIGRLVPFLEDEFGPYEVVHGELLEVFGIGVLILGKSSIGKSECALEIIKRGHRFIADDAVLLKRVSGYRIFGTSAHPFNKYYMEVRGLGIIDVLMLFGANAVKNRDRLELVITLETWDEKKDYNRSGLDEEYYSLLDIKLPHVTIPVQPGRDISIIVEVAALNLRSRKMGHHAAKEFNEMLIKEMQTGREPELELDEWGEIGAGEQVSR